MNWIQKNLLKIQSQEQLQTNFKIGSVFHTKFHSFFIDSTSEIKNTFLKENKFIKIYISEKKEIQSIESQDYIRNIIEQILRIEAKSYLPKRVDELAKNTTLRIKNWQLKIQKLDGGVALLKNNINLSLHLMRLREELIDYVILHELVHTKVKNHSREFWTTLDIHCPKSKSLDKELKKYSLRFY